jgi:hypothetical protein
MAHVVGHAVIGVVLIVTAVIIHQNHWQTVARAQKSVERDRKLLRELEVIEKEIEALERRRRDGLPGSGMTRKEKSRTVGGGLPPREGSNDGR